MPAPTRPRRGLLAAAAALVTLGTWLVFPGAYVFFGILHCIAAASLAGLMLLRAPWPLTLAAAAFCFVAPEFLTSATFDAPALFWLGLGTRETLTQDWRPFLPWAGALLLGVAIARAKPHIPTQRSAALPMEGWLTFLGRHSLRSGAHV